MRAPVTHRAPTGHRGPESRTSEQRKRRTVDTRDASRRPRGGRRPPPTSATVDGVGWNPDLASYGNDPVSRPLPSSSPVPLEIHVAFAIIVAFYRYRIRVNERGRGPPRAPLWALGFGCSPTARAYLYRSYTMPCSLPTTLSPCRRRRCGVGIQGASPPPSRRREEKSARSRGEATAASVTPAAAATLVPTREAHAAAGSVKRGTAAARASVAVV